MESIVSTVIPLLSGPASAVIVLLIVFGATYYIFAKQILPMFEKLLNKRDADFAVLMASHEADRAAWLISISKISEGIDELRASQDILSSDLDNVLHNVKVMREDVAKVLASNVSAV